MAMRAAEIFVFLIAGVFLDQREGGPNRPGQFHKFDVFFLAFPDVAGKRAEQRTEDQHVAQQAEKYAFEGQCVDQQDGQGGEQQEVVQRVGAIASVHKAKQCVFNFFSAR